jgi:hypothetical protein
MMTLGELWKEYHTLISLTSGIVLTLGLYKLPKLGPLLKLVILFCALFLLTGLMGVLKYALFALAILGYMYGGGVVLWIYGVIALGVADHVYEWKLAWWVIFLATGIWFPMSMFLDTLFRLVQVSRLKRIVSSDLAPDRDAKDQ